MRTITEIRSAIEESASEAEAAAALHAIALFIQGADSVSQHWSLRGLQVVRTDFIRALDSALAEVPTVLRERIAMWDRLIGKSTDDDEIRDAQAAQSELRWLLLQLEGETS
jgi:phosphopentomutase